MKLTLTARIAGDLPEIVPLWDLAVHKSLDHMSVPMPVPLYAKSTETNHTAARKAEACRLVPSNICSRLE